MTSSVPLIISAVPTPFDDALRIDRDAFAELLERLPDDHADVLVAGTTGEFPALDRAERDQLTRLAADVLGPDRVVAHVGAASLYESHQLAERAAAAGVRRVALLTPYYLPADDRQVIDHAHSFAAAHPELAVFPYLFPDRTGVVVGAATFRALMEPANVAGAKLSGRANDDFAAFAALVRPDQALYTGDDSRLPVIKTEGGAGVVSGCFAVVPDLMLRHRDDPDRIRAIVGLLGPSIARQKFALQAATGRPWRSRMSMPELRTGVAAEIAALVEQLRRLAPATGS
ncbi:dihydrodipicolinate synthase family protein [Microlunatus parietis]|uniref:4-hydroxy-tetrahydrodipicolinate synthase n=1 Tax=Microlunatus parietis TaxID=682979 RepID=A0A7Y9I7F0_9ACTN|nr:dihydrodipicolinate synthase family protein [Microlunatus parietis]NYE71681.1 4-hydroxy-tetrahydrodipicolinate synthase [Microlunatus parietis]